MDKKIDKKIEVWKKQLLDMGKKNPLMSHKEPKASSFYITAPEDVALYKTLVLDEKPILFPYIGRNADQLTNDNPFDVEQDEKRADIVIKGDVETNKKVAELQRILRTLKQRAKTATEEQGVNILYVSFGFLEWTEAVDSKVTLRSPLILVPVIIEQESILSPYYMRLHEDEIVVNPTLAYKLERDFNIELPSFDPQEDSLASYFAALSDCVKDMGWCVNRKISISLLSFLKINMYKDLEVRKESIAKNPIVKALCGINDEQGGTVPNMAGYDHDEKRQPTDTFQVMDADSSQMDAIELSKQGISFVLQGPPGTGKSQTITNIIAEALADGKKVLFVSEKMAALDVVYKRLASSGLSDFCLVLHSNKANKKELLDSLEATIKLKEKPVFATGEAIIELRRLAEKRKKLNDYCRQLHQVIEPMRQSVFEANGIIAGLETAPYISFDLSKIEFSSLTKEDFMDLRLMVQEYARTLGKLTETYEENTWRNSTLQKVTYALSHDIKAKFDSLVEKINNLNSGVVEYESHLGLKAGLSFPVLLPYSEALEFCGTASDFPTSWLDHIDFDAYEDIARKCEESENEQKQRKELIDSSFLPEFYSLHAEKAISEIERDIQDLKNILCLDNSDIRVIIDSTDTLILKSKTAKTCYDAVLSCVEGPAKDLQIPTPQTWEKLLSFVELLKVYDGEMNADKLWFNPMRWTKTYFEENVTRAEKLVSSVKSAEEKLLAVYEAEILSIDYKSILKRFKTEYTSGMRFLNSDFRKDNKKLKAFQRETDQKLSYEQVLELLQCLKSYHDATNQLALEEDEFGHALGTLYRGTESDFSAIRDSAQRFRLVYSYFGTEMCRDVKNEILEGRNVGKYEEPLEQLQMLLSDTSVSVFEELLLEPVQSISDGRHAAESVEILLEHISTQIGMVDEYRKPGTTKSVCWDCLLQLAEYQKKQAEEPALDSLCADRFGPLYAHGATDWRVLNKKLQWARQFALLSEQHGYSVDFQRGIATNAHTRIMATDFARYLRESYQNIAEEIQWLASLFEDSEKVEDRSLSELQIFITRCRNNLHGLEAWVDFCNSRKRCEDAGLTDFVQRSLEQRLTPEIIESAFIKRFEHEWLDFVMPSLPAVAMFRSANQNELIQEFRKLDTEQLRISQVRIRSALIQGLPDLNAITSGRDEVAVLRREMQKQRRIMPVRKLFASIPNLLPRLKPCLMMSPLSVSLFLQDENYRFDMVIFDEASQVRTENAIGAISRGKQVIIAGDVHQLPPTNFFAAAVSGEDEYDEEDDTDSYESVLSEAAAILPEEELKWHYRSRNESLIAFSNHKIYRDSLVTFPSPSEENDSEGIEYIYVPDGLYLRGTKRINPIEAKKVVDVVFDQIRCYPNRSMGVITFSEAQMHCVENELISQRIQHPEYEDFFQEGKEEAFFIKNLENVQGDERDTILFSIGYAKSNPMETLNMNFGPLNKSGGYRRLNVAVTRAKYAVKLIGSILPTDMSITDATPRGVSLLRDYIDFAQNGPKVLENELEYSDAVSTESPFEQAVYDFLTAKGFQLATQVGCSGYRIDMAVRHPQQHGKFVVGIECDGAMYHSSRTARERDRLRQSVLESMGWRFIRIWSTDWIKDPVVEGSRVVSEIQHAIEIYGTEQTFREIPKTETVSKYEEVKTSLPKKQPTDPRFRYYKEAHFPYQPYPATTPQVAKCANQVIQALSPVHIDLLYKQMAPLYNNERVSNKVRDGVDFVLRNFATEYGWKRCGDFIRSSMQTDIKPILPSGEGSRSIEYISQEELAEAMCIVVGDSFGLDKAGLFDAIARLYGFQRTTEKIIHSLEPVFDLIEKNGRIRFVSGKLTICEE